jgi:hypothetical protein
MELNIPVESILWNFEVESEEVDLIVFFRDQLWIFELKDRDFAAGDAHALNYRRVRYDADKTFILTAGKVLPDARRVFQELARQSQRGVTGRNRSGGVPIYIEGLSHATVALERELSDSAMEYAQQLLRPIMDAIGYDLSQVLVQGPGVLSTRHDSSDSIHAAAQQ